MARNKSNMLADGFGGGIGAKLMLRTRGDRTYLVRKPAVDPSRVKTENQEAAVMRFSDAILYAKGVMQDAEKKQLYDAAANQYQSGYNVAVADAVKPPKVSDLRTEAYMGNAGELIVVKAVDDFHVDQVSIAVFDAAGEKLEEGAAVRERNNRDWSYTTTVNNPVVAGSKIRVTARDLPGNTTTLEQTL